MKLLKKILKITGIVIASIFLFMFLLVLGAKIFENELASFTMEKLETEIDAPMSVGKVSLIPLFSFPRFSAEINDLWIGETNSYDGDTLLCINSFKVGLDTWDLIHGIYTIDKAEISGLNFDYIVAKNGKTNIDFLLDVFIDTTASTEVEIPENAAITPLEITAEKLKLENIRVNYYDSLTNIASRIYIPEISIKAKVKNDVYTAKTNGSFVLKETLLEGTKVEQMESCTITFDLEYEGKDATINELTVFSEGIDIGMEGTLRYSETLSANARLEALTLDFDILKKYLPDEYLKLFDKNQLGKMENVVIGLEMDYAGEDVNINGLSLNTEGIDIALEGSFTFGDTILTDAKFDVLELDLDLLKRFIPEQYSKEFGIIDIGGLAEISALINGSLADSTLQPQIDANVKLKNFRLQTRDYPQIDTLILLAQISSGDAPNMSKAVVKISDLWVKTPLSSFQLDGIIRGIEKPSYNISTNLDINLAEFSRQIPDTLAKNLKGNIVASLKTSGTLPEEIPDYFSDYVLDRSTFSISMKDISGLLMDSLQVDNFSTEFEFRPHNSRDKNIQIKNLNLQSETLNLNLQNCSVSAVVSGKPSDLPTLGAELQSFRIQNGSNLITGSAEINNFESPEFNINTNIFLKLDELVAYAPDSLLKNMGGDIKASIQSHGRIHLDSIDTQLYPILFENSSFDLDLNNISLAFADSIMDIENISARVKMKNDTLSIDDFSAYYNGLSLEMDSSIVQNIYKAVLLNQNEELYVKTHIKLGDIWFNDFQHLMAIESSQTETETESTSKNWTYLIHGSASVNKIIIDSTRLEGYNINRLHIDDLSTLFKLTDSTYIIDQFKFKAFDGEMNNSIHYKIREDGTQTISSHTVISKMNIRTLLRDMDNFGMDSLINYEHISGLLSTDLNTFTPIDDSVLIDKMMVSGDVVLEKGGVYDYPPAQEISSLPGLKDLDDLQFKTLRSSIFMFKNKLYVPHTNIVSNALDIAAFGMQSMDYDCEYHLEVHLSDILFKKSKKRTKKQEASGDEVDKESLKKASHKVRYSITDGESKVKRDTKESREAMMNKIRVQQKMLDFIFFPKNIHYSTSVDEKN